MKNVGRGATAAGIVLALAVLTGCQTVQRSPAEIDGLLKRAELTPELRELLAKHAAYDPYFGSWSIIPLTFRNVKLAGPYYIGRAAYCVSLEMSGLGSLGFFMTRSLSFTLDSEPGQKPYVVGRNSNNTDNQTCPNEIVPAQRSGPFPEFERVRNQRSASNSSPAQQPQTAPASE